MAINDLISVTPPPPDNGWREVDWESVERSLGLPLPQDYKDFVATYGPGTFDDFLHIFLPAADNDLLDLRNRQRQDIDSLRVTHSKFPDEIPYRVTEPAELLPVAITENGNIAYWHVTDPENPDSWTITINESRGPEWYRYPGGLTSFLADMLSRRIRVTVFPDDYPVEQPEFIPYEP